MKKFTSLQEAYSKVLNEAPYSEGPGAEDIKPALPAAKKDYILRDPRNVAAASAKEKHFGPEDALNDANIPITTKPIINVDDKETFRTLLTNPAEEGGKTDYGKMFGGIHKNPERRNKISRLMLGVTDAVFTMFTAEGGTLPDTRGEMQARISTIIKGITGWTDSAAIHPARQILTALVQSGIIKELGGSTAHGSKATGRPSKPAVDF
jgi:hypothetical protein